MANHNSNRAVALAELAPRSFRRSAFVQAARTNNPLQLPAGMRSRSPQGRRWRDLSHAWGEARPRRLADEATRAQLLNLIWLTMELECIRDLPTSQRPPVHTLLHMSQEQRVLLQQLGLNEPTQSNGRRRAGVALCNVEEARRDAAVHAAPRAERFQAAGRALRGQLAGVARSLLRRWARPSATTSASSSSGLRGESASRCNA